MSFRSIVISNNAKLFVKKNQLIITNEEEYSIPIEDISTIVIEAVGVTMTKGLLSKLAENNVVTYICDEKHLPNSVVLPLNNHYRVYKVLKEQLGQTQPFIKRCWQKVVIQKLYNQGECLKLCTQKAENELKVLAKNVESGDKGNKESIGAKIYFPSLFGKGFTREKDCWINAALNYGYTIIRGAVARSLVSYGFNTALGLNHCNELNSFNLADDFIEPFRQIVDLWVYKNKREDNLSKEDRMYLIDLLNYECFIAGKKHSIINGIDKMVASYVSAIESKDYSKLILPKLIPLEYHYYE